MAGPIAGYAQQAGLYQTQLATNNTAQQQLQSESVEPKAKQIEPQGTRAAGSEESDQTKNESPFDPQQAAAEILAQQEEAIRGAVINLLV